MFELPIIAGVIASVLHVVSGPDHLAAVTPMIIESKTKQWRIGLYWGIGHLLGMLLIGLLYLLFKDNIPVESISEHSEQLVAFVLIGIGLWALFKIFYRSRKHSHPHVHTKDGKAFVHIHEHDTANEKTHKHFHNKELRQSNIYALGIGVLHGLAGVAHFLILLPVLGFETQLESIAYILGFGVGTVLAMTIYALFLGNISVLSKKQNTVGLYKSIRVLGGVFALVVGCYWLYLSL